MRRVGIAMFTLLGASCSRGSLDDDPRRRLLEAWGNETVLPLYRDLEAAAGALEVRAGELCADTSSASLGAAQAAWWAARAPWKTAEVFAFGPVKLEPHRIGPKIDFWPARPDAIEEVLRGEEPVDPAAIAAAGAAKKGFPAIEYLLYGPPPERAAEFARSPRRCAYLRGLAADLTLRSAELRQAWDPAHGNYLGELVEAGQGSQAFASLQLALGEVVNRMGYTVENMRADKLAAPLGLTAGGSPDPDKAESPFSGRSVEDLRDNLRGLERVFFGAGGASLDSYLVSLGDDFGPAMRERLGAAHAALDAIELPLTRAVRERPDAVTVAMDRLGELQQLLQVDVVNALSLTVGFNDNDGD